MLFVIVVGWLGYLGERNGQFRKIEAIPLIPIIPKANLAFFIIIDLFEND